MHFIFSISVDRAKCPLLSIGPAVACGRFTQLRAAWEKFWLAPLSAPPSRKPRSVLLDPGGQHPPLRPEGHFAPAPQGEGRGVVEPGNRK